MMMSRHLFRSLALVALTVAAFAQPQDAVELYERGMRQKRAGNLAESAAELRGAIAAYPKYMQAHYALAWVYRGLGTNDASIEEFREVIRIAPHSPEAVEAARAIQRIRLGPGMTGDAARRRIAFASERDGNTDVYVMNLSGGSLVRITSHPAVDDSPSWSPDGRRLAFVSERDGNREIYLVQADGTGLQRLTDDPAADGRPVWSPDGELLAFESDRAGNMDVYVVTSGGVGLRKVTASPADDAMGDWSPDGRRLAILSTRDGPAKVYIIGVDGAGARRLTLNVVAEGRPVWAPDGDHIYFTWEFERNAQVCRAGLDGRSLANVTRSPYDERLCDVSPDGRRLLVTSNRQEPDEIHIIEMDVGSDRRLTFNPGADRDAVFAPWSD